jgi:hypothetical protein
MVNKNQQEKAEKRNISVVKSEYLSSYSDERYIIVDPETGEILDDAQGYGYKSKRKAYACWTWKTRDKSKDKEKARRKSHIQKWIEAHGDFMDNLEQCWFEIAKGTWGKEAKFNAKQVNSMLKDYGYEVDFTASELLKAM